MAENSLRVVARITARADTVEEIRTILLGLIEPTRKEQGCLDYRLLQNTEESADFTFVEEWTDPAAFQGHFSTEHVRAALPKLQELSAVAPDIRTYSAIA